MSTLLILYIIQTILGFIFWIKILGTRPTTFMQVLTYLIFSLILIPNFLALGAYIWGKYDKYKKESVLNHRKSLQE